MDKISTTRGCQGGHSTLRKQCKQTHGHGECAQGKSNSLIRLDRGCVSSVLGDKAGNGVRMVLKIIIRDFILDLRSCGVLRWGPLSCLSCHIFDRLTYRGEVLMGVLSHICIPPYDVSQQKEKLHI